MTIDRRRARPAILAITGLAAVLYGWGIWSGGMGGGGTSGVMTWVSQNRAAVDGYDLYRCS